MRIDEIIQERQIPKNTWELLLTTGEKTDSADQLIDLVGTAYQGTDMGSFVNSVQDVLPSDWSVLDWDQDPDLDVLIFYREPRANEAWQGYKIQGIGHDGQRTSKDKAIQQLVKKLNQPGWWIEASGAVRHILMKQGAPIVSDEEILQKLFPDSGLTMVDEYTYTRLAGSQKVTETVFGKPRI